ncbi:hypothetical protein NBRC116493_09090 [Aurantivibrio infirmus]
MKFIKLIFVLTIMMFTAQAYSQSNSPEILAKQYFEALQDEGLPATVEFMHPDALKRFKEMLVPVFEVESESGQRQLLDMTFGASASITDVKNSEPKQFFSSFMNLVAAQMGDTKLSFGKLEVLGTIAEGEQRHVLTRITVGADDVAATSMEIVSFLPYEDSWAMQLSGDIEGLANSMRSAYQQ